MCFLQLVNLHQCVLSWRQTLHLIDGDITRLFDPSAVVEGSVPCFHSSFNNVASNCQRKSMAYYLQTELRRITLWVDKDRHGAPLANNKHSEPIDRSSKSIASEGRRVLAVSLLKTKTKNTNSKCLSGFAALLKVNKIWGSIKKENVYSEYFLFSVASLKSDLCSVSLVINGLN